MWWLADDEPRPAVRDAGPTATRRARWSPTIYGWFTEGFDTPDLKDAKALLDQLNPLPIRSVAGLISCASAEDHRDPARMALAEERSEHSVAWASAPNSQPTERKSK